MEIKKAIKGNINKWKSIRKEIIKIFLLLFLGQMVALLIIGLIGVFDIKTLKFQLTFFGIYFIILLLTYIFIHKIIKKYK